MSSILHPKAKNTLLPFWQKLLRFARELSDIRAVCVGAACVVIECPARHAIVSAAAVNNVTFFMNFSFLRSLFYKCYKYNHIVFDEICNAQFLEGGIILLFIKVLSSRLFLLIYVKMCIPKLNRHATVNLQIIV